MGQDAFYYFLFPVHYWLVEGDQGIRREGRIAKKSWAVHDDPLADGRVADFGVEFAAGSSARKSIRPGAGTFRGI
jgi:hypothetical protein